MPRSLARLSASASSHRDLSLAVFITNIAESDFWYTQVLVFGEAHLRQILSSYAAYYNEVRTHLALGKDAPLGRTVQRTGAIVAIPILSGLHHHYVRT